MKELPIDQMIIVVYKFTKEVSKKYEVGDNVALFLEGEIVDDGRKNNQDGTVNWVVVFKPKTVQVIKDDDDK